MKKFLRLPLNLIDKVQTKVRQPFFNFLICPSHCYDVLKEGVQDVKWDQLICQKPQQHASKIRILYRSGAQYLSSVMLIHARQVSAKQRAASMF
jgi:hypothetical protein